MTDLKYVMEGIGSLSNSIGNIIGSSNNSGDVLENFKSRVEMLLKQNEADLAKIVQYGNKFMGTQITTMVRNGWGDNADDINQTNELVKKDLTNSSDFYKANLEQEYRNTKSTLNQIQDQLKANMVGGIMDATKGAIQMGMGIYDKFSDKPSVNGTPSGTTYKLNAGPSVANGGAGYNGQISL
ncbi:MAG: hypothetical protein LBH46_02800 [Rickettsiales bacterium]|jgi:hypothetical protein|nr:hypothetical protein [Rickettsiales bacterium]